MPDPRKQGQRCSEAQRRAGASYLNRVQPILRVDVAGVLPIVQHSQPFQHSKPQFTNFFAQTAHRSHLLHVVMLEHLSGSAIFQKSRLSPCPLCLDLSSRAKLKDRQSTKVHSVKGESSSSDPVHHGPSIGENAQSEGIDRSRCHLRRNARID